MLDAPRAQAWFSSRGRAKCVRVGRYFFRHSFAGSLDRTGEIIDRLLSLGRTPAVSSWGGVWRQLTGCLPPMFRKDVRDTFQLGKWPFAWEEQTEERLTGPWVMWDMKSAYRWAASGGLPAPQECRLSYDPTPRPRCFHLVTRWRQVSTEAEIRVVPTWARYKHRPVESWLFAPPPKREATWIPGDAANMLGLVWKPEDHVLSIEWSRERNLSRHYETVERHLPPWAAKLTLASHWGGWADGHVSETAMVERGREVKRWRLFGDAVGAAPWAGIVVARVTMRVAEAADHGSPRIYADSVLLPEGDTPSPVGDRPGCWVAKERFVFGVQVPQHPRRPVQVVHPEVAW